MSFLNCGRVPYRKIPMTSTKQAVLSDDFARHIYIK